jgi:aryl-alcohol dehydrogenase-like predicted oxidoreductase
MKPPAAVDKLGAERFVANQTCYSLNGRGYEWELMPFGIDPGVGAIVWSPRAWGRLTGKIRRRQVLPADGRPHETEGELAADTPDCRHPADRRARRDAVAAEPLRARLGIECGADCEPGYGECGDSALPLLPVLERAVFGAESGCGLSDESVVW